MDEDLVDDRSGFVELAGRGRKEGGHSFGPRCAALGRVDGPEPGPRGDEIGMVAQRATHRRQSATDGEHRRSIVVASRPQRGSDDIGHPTHEGVVLDPEPTFADHRAPAGEVLGVSLFCPSEVAGCATQLGAELANDVEHAIPTAAVVELQQPDICQPSEVVARDRTIVGRPVVVIDGSDHRGSGLRVEGGVERGEAYEHALLEATDETEAPLDRRPEGCVPSRLGPITHPPTDDLGDSGGNGRQRNAAEPGCSQLERQRHPVELPADRGDVPDGLPVDHHPRASLPGADQEQAECVMAIKVVERDCGGFVGHGQLWNPPNDLTCESEWLPAGDQRACVGAPRQQGREHSGGGIEHVFGIVEHQERALAPQPTLELADHVMSRHHPDLGCDLLGNVRGRSQHTEIHPPGVSAVAFACGRRDAYGQSRLPTPTRTCEGHDPILLQQRSELGHLLDTPDEGAQRDRHGRTFRSRYPSQQTSSPSPRRMPRTAEQLEIGRRCDGPVELHPRC